MSKKRTPPRAVHLAEDLVFLCVSRFLICSGPLRRRASGRKRNDAEKTLLMVVLHSIYLEELHVRPSSIVRVPGSGDVPKQLYVVLKQIFQSREPIYFVSSY